MKEPQPPSLIGGFLNFPVLLRRKRRKRKTESSVDHVTPDSVPSEGRTFLKISRTTWSFFFKVLIVNRTDNHLEYLGKSDPTSSNFEISGYIVEFKL